MKKIFILYFFLASCTSSPKVSRIIASYQHSAKALGAMDLYFNDTVQRYLKQLHKDGPETTDTTVSLQELTSVKKVICNKLEISECDISVSTVKSFETENIKAIFITNKNTGTNTVYSLFTGKTLQIEFSEYSSINVYDLENSNESIMLVFFTFDADRSNIGFIVRDTSTEQFKTANGPRKTPYISLRGYDDKMSYLWKEETLIDRDKVKANKYETLVRDGNKESDWAKALSRFKGKGIRYIKIKPPTFLTPPSD